MDEARGPEDRIEHIVTEAEQGAQFEFNPAAWAAMEQKLDALEPVPFSVWKIIFPLIGIVLLLGVLLWPIGAQELQQVAPKGQTIQPAPEPAKDAITQSTDESAVESDNPQAASEAVVDSQSDTPSTKTATIVRRSVASNRVVTSEGVASDPSAGVQADQQGVQNNALADSDLVPQLETSDSLSSQYGTSALYTNGFGVEALVVRWNPIPVIWPVFNAPMAMDTTGLMDEEAKPYFEKSKWAFSAMVSLDMSATGLDGFTDPGTMFGLGVEYYFAPGWSIQSGAAISVKKYTALGSEYETPTWPDGRTANLVAVAANCLVIDVPLNIRKYFNTKKGKTFFASAGVSSYLMLREDYNYEYTEDRPNWAPEWSIRNANKHYLGILNLSFGYEKPLGKKLALGIEPFMKLPLTGIGQGQVKFLSFGTNIAIKLRK